MPTPTLNQVKALVQFFADRPTHTHIIEVSAYTEIPVATIEQILRELKGLDGVTISHAEEGKFVLVLSNKCREELMNI